MSSLKGLFQYRCLNSLSASLTKPHRNTYRRNYPTVLVYPDGSTINIRCPEPRQIVKLPVNIWTLSEADRKARLELRKPKKKVKIEDDLEDLYDSRKYLKYIKNK